MFKLHWKEYICEFLGTAIFLYIGLTGIYFGDLVRFPDYFEFFFIGLAFCIAIIGVFYSPMGKTSGCHLNPAVTTAFWFYRLMNTVDAIFYVIFQFFGAVFGSAIAFMFYNRDWEKVRLALTLPSNDYPVLLIMSAEAVLTCCFVLLILSFLASDKYRKFTGFAIGIYILFATVLFAPLTGASLNPVRSFGPAILLMDFRYLWLYFIGPITGAMAAVLLFRTEINKKQLKLSFCAFKCTPEKSI